MILEWVAMFLLVIACTLGLALAVLGLAGTFIVLGGAILYNVFTWSMAVSFEVLALLLILALVGEGLEWLTPAIHGKTSWYAVAGMILGAMIGASALSFIFLIGSVAGLILGGIAGAYIGELFHTHDMDKAWQAAKIALKNRIVISATKTILAIIQIIAIIIAI